MTMTWAKGRQLSTLIKGNTSVAYSYDADGTRLSKTVNGTKYTYQYVGGKLLQETRGNAIIDYSYDANGSVSAFRYKANSSDSGTYYYYARNWLGDIVGIYNSSGTLIARYNYDAWGNPTSVTDANGNAITSETHIANINPFRYRSYYYDSETGLYYLNNRYYDPVIGRFINADAYVQTGQGMLDKNMFAYCMNNPVNRVDSTGEISWLVVGFLLGTAIVGGVLGALSDDDLAENARKNNTNKNNNISHQKDAPSLGDTLPQDNPLPNKTPQKNVNTTNQVSQKSTLTTADRIKNTFIGASLGLLVGSGVVMLGAALGSAVVGSVTTTIGALGASGSEAFALGAIAFDVVATVAMPFFGIEIEPVEYKQ